MPCRVEEEKTKMKKALIFMTLASVASVAYNRLIALKADGVAVKIHEREASNTCTAEFQAVTNSTYCATDSPNYISGTAGVSEADKQTIIDRHNFHRRAVTPTATNMMKVYWDDQIAIGAEKWARQCQTGHDYILQMTQYVPHYGQGPGQNAAYGYNSWQSAIDGWHNEVQLFQYGGDPEIYIGTDGWKQIGHYTQVVTATVMLVGCGYAECNVGYGKHYICNYITGQWNIPKPYINGTTCSACQTSCDNNLCDCGDKYCFNGGTIDIDTCTCSCKFPWQGEKCLTHPCPGVTCENGGTLVPDTCTCSCKYPYTGDTCATKTCEDRVDPYYCGTQWPKSYCIYSSVPSYCPVLCDVCPEPCNGKQCQNGGTLETPACTCNCKKFYTGDNCETLDCPNTADPGHCGTQWPEAYCTQYTNVPDDCPIMCGICPALCDGKQCQNGGTLETPACTCNCKKFFKGDNCETLDCPNTADPDHCGPQWPEAYCTQYTNVPDDCPIMCGICPAV